MKLNYKDRLAYSVIYSKNFDVIQSLYKVGLH